MGEAVDIDAVYDGHKGAWIATISVDEQPTKFKLDSGADVIVIYHNLKSQVNLKPTSKILLGPCNYKMDCIGKFTAKLSTHSMMVKEDIYVVKGLERPLLSREATEKLKLINRIHALSSKDYKTKVMTRHPGLFKGLGQMKDQYDIKLKETAKPFAITVPRRVPLPLFEI